MSDEQKVFRIDETVLYKRETGELQTYLDGQLREVISVRAQLLDRMIRQAAIVELERLGYTVISPEAEGGE